MKYRIFALYCCLFLLTSTLHSSPNPLSARQEQLEMALKGIDEEQSLLSAHLTTLEELLHSMHDELEAMISQLELRFKRETEAHIALYQSRCKLQDEKIALLEEALRLLSRREETLTSSLEEEYSVQPGDCLESIAKRFRIAVDTIKSINHLKSDRIFIGQKLKLRGAR